MGEPIRCQDAAARAEEFLRAVAAAEVIVEGARDAAPSRRRQRVVCAMGLLVVASPFAGALGNRALAWQEDCGKKPGSPSLSIAALVGGGEARCAFSDVSQCRDLCDDEGRCALEAGDCRASNRAHCESSRACKRDGRCSVMDGRCAALTDGDCSGSEACRERGACRATPAPSPDSVCVVADDLDCAASEACAQRGQCAAVAGACVQREKKSCAYSDACAREGHCSNTFQGQCRAASDEDCRYAESCLDQGRCMASRGHCIALADSSCRRSLGCQERGRCVADGGHCVAPLGQPADAR